MARADALVIGVEAIFEALVEHAIAGQEALQQEGLEEPGGVREVPFGRARIVHRLDDLVLIAQWRRKLGRERARLHEARLEDEEIRFGARLRLGEGSGPQAHHRLPRFRAWSKSPVTRATSLSTLNARFTSLFRLTK